MKLTPTKLTGTVAFVVTLAVYIKAGKVDSNVPVEICITAGLLTSLATAMLTGYEEMIIISLGPWYNRASSAFLQSAFAGAWLFMMLSIFAYPMGVSIDLRVLETIWGIVTILLGTLLYYVFTIGERVRQRMFMI